MLLQTKKGTHQQRLLSYMNLFVPSMQAVKYTWMTLHPASSRAATSLRRARASWYDWAFLVISLRGNDQLRIVTGPAGHQQRLVHTLISAIWAYHPFLSLESQTSVFIDVTYQHNTMARLSDASLDWAHNAIIGQESLDWGRTFLKDAPDAYLWACPWLASGWGSGHTWTPWQSLLQWIQCLSKQWEVARIGNRNFGPSHAP